LSVNPPNGKEDLYHEEAPEKADDPTGKQSWRKPIETDCADSNQHGAEISKAVDVKRVNEVIDIKNVPPDVEYF